MSVFIAMSLDGFIAREDGNLDRLDEASASLPEGEDCGHDALVEPIDTMVMGVAHLRENAQLRRHALRQDEDDYSE